MKKKKRLNSQSIDYLSNLFKGYSLLREISLSLVFSFIFNSLIVIVSLIFQDYFIISTQFINFYYIVIIGSLTIYATIAAISTNLSQEFPLKISLKYIINQKLSLSYLFIIFFNFLISSVLSIKNPFPLAIDSFLFSSNIFLVPLTMVFILVILNKLDYHSYMETFFEDMFKKTSRFFDSKTGIPKNYKIEENEDFSIIASKNFEKCDKSQIKTLLRDLRGKGRLKVKDWEFLNKISRPIRLSLKRYEFRDGFSPQMIFQYGPGPDKSSDDGFFEDSVNEIINQTITYKDYPKEEFAEMFYKLKKNGTEGKFVDLMKKYILKYETVQEQRFVYSSFEEFFKEFELNKNRFSDEDTFLDVEINNLYEQRNFFFNSPAIVGKLQNRLTYFLSQRLIKTDRFLPKLNKSGLSIRSLVDLKYPEIYEKSENDQFIKEYDYLVRNTIENIFEICKVIIDSVKEELKKDYLLQQITFLNGVLDDCHRGIRLNQNKRTELTDKKEN